MLNEFKRSMWNDGYSKEQPWLNYYNSYERMHCCFGDDGSDGSGSGGVGTGGPGVEDDIVDVAPEDFSIGPGTGMGPDGSVPDPEDFEKAQNAADPDPDPRDATYNAETDSFSFAQDKDTDTFASDIATIGFENFSNPSDLGLDTLEAMYEDPEAYGMGYNDFVNADFFDKSEAADYAKSQAQAAALQDSYTAKGKDVGISVAKDGTYSYTGADAFSTMMSEIGKAAESYMGTFSTLGVVSNFISNVLGIDKKDVTQEQVDTAINAKGGMRSDEAPIAGPEIDTTYGQYDPGFSIGSSDMSYGQSDPGFNIGSSDMSYGQSDPGADFSDFQSTSQPDVMGFNSAYTGDGDDPLIKKPPLVVAKAAPEEEPTAMQAYFKRLGIASPAFQQQASYTPPIEPAANAAYRRKLALATPKYQEPSGPNRSIATLAAAYGLTYDEAAKRFAPPSVPPPRPEDVEAGLPAPTPVFPMLRPKKAIDVAGGGGLRGLMEYS